MTWNNICVFISFPFSASDNTSHSRWWRERTTYLVLIPTVPPRLVTLDILFKILKLRKIQGVLNQTQMEILTDKHLMEKHRTFRLNTGKNSPGLKSLHSTVYSSDTFPPQLTWSMIRYMNSHSNLTDIPSHYVTIIMISLSSAEN